MTTLPEGSADALYAACVGVVAELKGTAHSAARPRGERPPLRAASFNAQGYEQNRVYAEGQAKDAIARGEEGARRSRMAMRMLIGAQRARLAANNVKLDSGSPLAVQMDTRMLGELDVTMIRENAKREADGYRSQGASYGVQAALTRSQGDSISPFLAVAPTVLTSAGSVADKWLRFKQAYTQTK